MELPLFCFFWLNFNNISKRRNYQTVGVSGIAKCGIANCGMQWTKVQIAVAEKQNCGLVAVDYSKNSGSRGAELWTSGSALRKK
jgi:hypothetical protein